MNKDYGKNLKVVDNRVISYTTHVATIDGGKLLVHGKWSNTTSRHINTVADDYGLTKVDSPKPEDNSHHKSVALVASLAALFTDNKKESNDWKARMLKAGLSTQGLIIPEDWDTLTEDEKEKRLDGVIDLLKK